MPKFLCLAISGKHYFLLAQKVLHPNQLHCLEEERFQLYNRTMDGSVIQGKENGRELTIQKYDFFANKYVSVLFCFSVFLNKPKRKVPSFF